MKKRVVFLLALAALSLMLGGCQLAQKTEPLKDRFVGVNLVAIPEDQEGDDARSEPHEPDGYYFLVPFAYSDDGTQYTKAIRSGPYSERYFNSKTTNDGQEYTIRTDLYIGDLIEPGIALYLEPVYEREDGSFYAVGPGQAIDMLSDGTITYGYSDQRVVTGEDGKKENETTSVYVNLINEPLPD